MSASNVLHKPQIISRILASLLFGSILTACGGEGTDPQKTAAVLSGDAKSAAAASPRCALFTQGEIAKYLGEAVTAGRSAAMGAGCQWLAADGSGNVIVTIAPSNNHAPPSGVEGFKELAVGTHGFVAPQTAGWAAGAIVGTDTIFVSVEGAAATEANTVALLKDAIGRRV